MIASTSLHRSAQSPADWANRSSHSRIVASANLDASLPADGGRHTSRRSWPLPASRVTICVPTKPLAPVTSTVLKARPGRALEWCLQPLDMSCPESVILPCSVAQGRRSKHDEKPLVSSRTRRGGADHWVVPAIALRFLHFDAGRGAGFRRRYLITCAQVK